MGKSVASIVKRTVVYELEHRARPPVHVIGIDEVGRRKGQVYLTVDISELDTAKHVVHHGPK